ncbi:hypothetical protein Tco_1254018 [Tanacetum coccineum]
MARFKELKTHLEFLHNTNSHSVGRNMRPYEIAFQILFKEEYDTFRVKMIHNLNQLQCQLESKYLHISDPKSCLDVLKTQFKEFFDSKEYLDVLDMLIDERTQESLVTEGAALEANLITEGVTIEANFVTEGTVIDACLITEGIEMDDSLVAKERTDDSVTSSEQLDESSSSRNECNRSGNENRSSDHESTSSGNDIDADIGPSYDSDTVSEVYHGMFENMFVHDIQNHEQPESIPDTYVVNENNSNIISHTPNMDPDRDKEEHDYVDYKLRKEGQTNQTLRMLLPKEDNVQTTGFENKNEVENPVIMEYLVKINKKARIMELKQRHLKINVLTSFYLGWTYHSTGSSDIDQVS